MDVGRSGTDEGGLGEERGWGMYSTRKGDRPTADDLRLLEGGEDWVNKYDVDDDWDCARGRQTDEPDRS